MRIVIEGDAVNQSEAAEAPLLPGETSDSGLPDDAVHWATVYEELIGFLVHLDPPEGTFERYQRRLEYWRCRRDEAGRAAEPNRRSSDAGD